MMQLTTRQRATDHAMPSTAKRPDDNRWTDSGDIANRLFFKLYQASNLMHKEGTNAVSAFGTTTQQWAVLGALSRPQAIERGLSVKQLMEYLMVSRQSLTAVLDRLEGAGLIDRTRTAGDGRLRHVRLTKSGARTWGEMRPAIRGFYDAALADFSIEERYLLMRLLDRLSAGLAKL
jgi:MarR family transcriptional regulator, organic hydroperoxide resistance regulator